MDRSKFYAHVIVHSALIYAFGCHTPRGFTSVEPEVKVVEVKPKAKRTSPYVQPKTEGSADGRPAK